MCRWFSALAPGAFHAFEVIAGDAAISRSFIDRRVAALKRAFATGAP